ncbi:MAG: hypothetical protein CL678_10130 [Bdellovibrionaceae bacterium]|nr:hypothetical protein [Pseudobdellovibrionaceae bacterium]
MGTKNLIRSDESGQAVVEYLLILSLGVTLAISVAVSLNEALSNQILRFGAVLEKDLRTGRAPANVYKN